MTRGTTSVCPTLTGETSAGTAKIAYALTK